MMTFLVFKERLRQFYNKYELYITPVYKFLSTWIILMILNQQIGFMSQLTNPIITMVVSLISAVVPGSLTILMICGITIMHVFTLSMELAAVVLVLLIVMYILYFRFVPKETMVILWIPALYYLKIPVLVPIIMGLVGTPLSVISVAFGTIFHFVLDYMANNTAVINNVASGESIQKINTLVNGLLKDPMLMLNMLAFVLVVIIVYILRRMSMNYSWQIAIVTGTVTSTVIMLVGNLKLDLTKENPVVWIVAGNLIAMVIAFILQFFILSLDYSCTEYVQYEDDEYYYYVKAVPKIAVTAPQVNVKRINAKKPKTERLGKSEILKQTDISGMDMADEDVPPLDIDLKMISEMADMEERLRQERARRRQMAAAREEQMMQQGMRQQMSQGTRQQMPQGTRQQMPRGTRQQTPQGTRQQMSQGTRQQMPQGTRSQMSQGTRRQTSQGVQRPQNRE